tara:strand:- start:765 stop:1571 length:807 start_codon:yes stop_codon:yes gene_type:complete
LNITINKLKWLIKKIGIFLRHPLLSINNNFDFDFLNAVFMNNKLINKNKELNNLQSLSAIKKLNFDKETNLSIQNSEHLNKVVNSNYFTNLNYFGYGYRILESTKFKDFDYINSFHLYPANIFAINEIKNLIDKNLIGDGLIIDYPSGIGNLFIYLQKIINKNNFVGIDNFEQISKNDIEKYQNNTGSNVLITTFEDFILNNENRAVDLIVSIELDLDIIIKNIFELNPKFLIFETMYVSRFKDIMKMLNEKYKVYLINESIIIYLRK